MSWILSFSQKESNWPGCWMLRTHFRILEYVQPFLSTTSALHNVHNVKCKYSKGINFPVLLQKAKCWIVEFWYTFYLWRFTYLCFSIWVYLYFLLLLFHFVEQPRRKNMCRKLQFMQHFTHTWKATLFLLFEFVLPLISKNICFPSLKHITLTIQFLVNNMFSFSE